MRDLYRRLISLAKHTALSAALSAVYRVREERSTTVHVAFSISRVYESLSRAREISPVRSRSLNPRRRASFIPTPCPAPPPPSRPLAQYRCPRQGLGRAARATARSLARVKLRIAFFRLLALICARARAYIQPVRIYARLPKSRPVAAHATYRIRRSWGIFCCIANECARILFVA